MLYSIRAYLNTIVARRHFAILYLHILRRVTELALQIGAGAFVSLELPAHLKLEPPGVKSVTDEIWWYLYKI